MRALVAAQPNYLLKRTAVTGCGWRATALSNTPQALRLRDLLARHGVAEAPVSAASAWAAFKDFGREVFGLESVGLLFQVGVYDFTGQPLFCFDPVCQFEQTGDEGEHDHLEQCIAS